MTFLPLWMEILVNVIGYAGFIGIATWHKSSDEITKQLSPAWSFEAVTTPGQGSTHLTIDHFLARGRKIEHWPTHLTAARSHTFRLKQRPDIGAFVAADLIAPPDHRASRAAVGIAELFWQLPVE